LEAAFFFALIFLFNGKFTFIDDTFKLQDIFRKSVLLFQRHRNAIFNKAKQKLNVATWRWLENFPTEYFILTIQVGCFIYIDVVVVIVVVVQ
jgi:hypothetical protein